MKLNRLGVLFSCIFFQGYFSYGQSDLPAPEYFTPRNSSFKYTFIHFGMGLTSREGIQVFESLLGELGTVRNRNIFSGRFWYNRDLLTKMEKESGETEPVEKMSEVGLLYGRYFPLNKIAFTVNVGIGYSSGIVRSDWVISPAGFKYYEYKNFNEAAIPIKVEMLAGRGRKYTFSLAFLAELNNMSPYYGIQFCFRFGNERRTLKD